MNTFTAEQLLSIKTPEKLFSKNVMSTLVDEYRELAKKWHPDRTKDKRAGEVFSHISKLRDEGEQKIRGDIWGFEGSYTFQSKKYNFYRSSQFELGSMYICDDCVIYEIHPDHRKLGKGLIESQRLFTYKTSAIEKEVKRYLPVKTDIHITDHQFICKIHKTPDLLCLRDVLNHYDNMMDPKAVAWIISSLCNLCCYFENTGIVHHDISPDTYFISPKYHSGALLGGWWYAAKLGSKISVVPSRTHTYLPWNVKTNKIASSVTDLELIRTTGRELLGDITGKNLNKDAREEVVEWLTSVAQKGSIDNYREWIQVLEKPGPRKYTPMELDAATLYDK